MKKRMFVGGPVVVAVLSLVSGCSAIGAATEGLRIGKNLNARKKEMRIWVDGHQAESSVLKKAYFGHASFKVKETVSTRPTFRFAFKDPSKFGRITGTNLQIHQEYEGDYSHQAEFAVFPREMSSEYLMRPDVDYNLGSVGSNLKCLNFEKQEVSGVELKPGLEYMLVFTVSGDRSDSVQVLLSTK